MVLLLRDRVPDAALTQIGADLAVAVRLVSAHAVRGAAGAPEPRAGNADLVPDRLELGAVRPLPRCDEQGQRAAAALRGNMDLGRQPATGAAEGLTRRTASSSRSRRIMCAYT
ncbi:hypothetical protein HEK616_83210 (plasmid) [Streptomyces nigrescens]|uniref:Uncharacterized protein n=1 Tax=Streptomyces nigrescens TaxID=1920 RepID=A0ABM8A7Y9_STRNI|nr:hypothetical protein HEK616_83210 [Streptomyces nigrescens]